MIKWIPWQGLLAACLGVAVVAAAAGSGGDYGVSRWESVAVLYAGLYGCVGIAVFAVAVLGLGLKRARGRKDAPRRRVAVAEA